MTAGDSFPSNQQTCLNLTRMQFHEAPVKWLSRGGIKRRLPRDFSNSPPTASSVTIASSPFPINVQANTSLNLQMDFDLMDSLQTNMSMSPMMTSMMQQTMPGSNMFDEMDDLIGKVSSVSTANNQFTMSFAQGMPSMTPTVDANTTFQDFDSIGTTNSIAGLAQGQIVLVRIGLMAGGMLHAEKVRFESNNQVLDGMVVAVNSSTQFFMVVMKEAPAFQGVNMGDVIHMNLQAGTMFDIDDMDLPASGMSFAGSTEMIVGQMVQIELTSALVPGTPSQLNTNHVRLMKTWTTAKVASKIDANTFTVNNLPGMFGTAGFSSMTVTTSSQTEFDNVSNVAALTVGDKVSVRGPMFLVSGTPTIIAARSRSSSASKHAPWRDCRRTQHQTAFRSGASSDEAVGHSSRR